MAVQVLWMSVLFVSLFRCLLLLSLALATAVLVLRYI